MFGLLSGTVLFGTGGLLPNGFCAAKLYFTALFLRLTSELRDKTGLDHRSFRDCGDGVDYEPKGTAAIVIVAVLLDQLNKMLMKRRTAEDKLTGQLHRIMKVPVC